MKLDFESMSGSTLFILHVCKSADWSLSAHYTK